MGYLNIYGGGFTIHLYLVKFPYIYIIFYFVIMMFINYNPLSNLSPFFSM